MKKIILLLVAIAAVCCCTVSALSPSDYTGNVSFHYNITPGMGDQTNYQVKFILSNASGVSGYYAPYNVIYTNGSTRVDWYDVNVTDGSGNPVPFWIENNTATAYNVSAWVKVPSITVDNTSTGIWYFGNSTQSASTANGYATFEDGSFDDFSVTSLNTTQWKYTVPGSPLFVTGGISFNDTAYADSGIRSLTQFPVNRTFESYGRFTVGTSMRYSIGFIGQPSYIANATANNTVYYGTDTSRSVIAKYTGSNITTIGAGSPATVYEVYSIKRNGGSQVSYYSSSGNFTTFTETNTTYIPTGSLNITLGTAVNKASGATNILSWVFVRKSVQTEPITSLYESYTPAMEPLIADFNASFSQTPNPSMVDQEVQFNDTSVGSPTTWNWTFGDGNTSTEQNPTHTYTTAGNYTVLLNVSNSTGSFSEASNWHNVTNATGFTPRDVWQVAQITKTFRITSSTTGLPITTVDLYLDGVSTYTTTNGTGYVTGTFGEHSVSFISEGYTGRTISYFFDTDETHDVQLTPSTTPSSSSKLNVLYPKEVRITCVSEKGARLPGVLVAGVMVNSTVENTNWFSTLFSISESATPINGTEIGGTTDTGGAVVMPMIGSGYYRLIFNSTTYGINQKEYFLQPQYNDYVYTFETLTDISEANPDDYINITLGATDSGAATIYLNASYNDSSLSTADVTFFVNYPNRTTLYSKTYPSISGSNQSVIVSYAVTNTAGDSYVYGMSGNSTTFGFRNMSQGISLKGTTGIMYDPFAYKGSW